MKIKVLVKLLIAFSFVITASISIIIACGGWDDDGYGYSDFAPEPNVDSTYTPLFYSSSEMFYGIWYDGGYIERFNDEILTDWQNFLKSKIDKKELSFLLFDEKSPTIIDDLFAYVSKNAKIGSYTEWASKIDLNTNEIKSFIEFLYLAKKVELSSKANYDYWDYENAVKPNPVDINNINLLKSKFENSKNNFLKNRYWFQLIKAYFYSDQKAVANSFFEKTSHEMPRNTLYYRALSYLAGIAYQSKDYAKSNYLYSIVFDKCVSMRTTATYCFHPQNESDWNAALEMAKSNDEKAALWALLGYYMDEGRSIKEIYQLNPKSPHLDFLLSRLINKTEQSIYYNSIGLNQTDKPIVGMIKQENLELINSIAQAGNTAKPYFWNLAAAYLHTLSKDYKQATILLNNTEKQLPDGQQYKDQLRLLRLINTLSEATIMNEVIENQLVTELNWLYHELPKSAGEKFRYSKSSYWSKSYISALYKKQNNAILSQLFNPGSEFYHSDANVQEMKAFLEKENKSPFEKLAASIYPVTIGDIYEYLAVVSTYDNKIDQAYSYIQKAEGRKDILLKANPFNGFIKDCHDCEHASPQKTKYSKFRLIEIIQIMQTKIKNGEDLFNNYLLLANAFYNISYYGNARVFYEGSIIGDGQNYTWDLDNYYEKMINSMANAKMYYEKALQSATTNEQKARCCYMLAKCQRNDFYNGTGRTELNAGYDFLAWDGFKLLKNKYSGTKFYKEVIEECGYFLSYSKL